MPGAFGLVLKLDAADNDETFPHLFTEPPSDDADPRFTLTVDGKGNLNGTTPAGAILGVEPTSCPNTSRELGATAEADGSTPEGTLPRDSAGSIYGTTDVGRAFGLGFGFELTP